MFVVALVVATMGVSVPTRAQFLSPGPLSREHASLEGTDHCDDCHSGGRDVVQSKCLGCHGDVGARISGSAGLHGREYRGQACVRCHVEHRGRAAPQVRWNPRTFEHRQAGWRLEGGHQRVECNGCHNRRNRRGARTFLGLSTSCQSCHQDPHQGRLGTTCNDCHGEQAWSAVRLDRFDHTRTRFPLRGGHSRVDCARCHRDPPQWSGIQFRSCANCHDDPHAGRYRRECGECHNEQAWDNLEDMRAAHPGLSLGGGHSRVSCQACHGSDVTRPPGRGSRCLSCHRSVHEAAFGDNCASCHRSIRWRGLPENVALSAHAQTPFPLGGRHREIDCARCHDPNRSAQQRYRELTFSRCTDCHEDRHGGVFARRDGGACEPCHSDAGFSPSTFTVALHRTTQFPLQGRHQAVPCTRCHPGERPRLTWHVSAPRCDSCHENPHGNQFATEMQRGGCAGCHVPAGWEQPNIDHSQWPLIGAHEVTPCNGCHTPSEDDRRQAHGASYRGLPRECEGCHQDVHAGQFRLTDPVRGCDVCHTAASFHMRRFDHTAIADFPLQGAHRRTRCTGCHREERLRDGTNVRRYRLGYRACSDCHANPHAGGGQ